MEAGRGPVAVTGGAGFLGEHVIRHLVAAGRPARVIDVVEPPGWLEGLGVDFVRADVRDAGAVDRAVDGAAAVIHGAFASPRADLATISSVNVGGTAAVLDAATRAGVPRVVVVSSTVVQRRIAAHPVARRSPLSRLAAYRESRVAAERLALARPSGFPSVAVARPRTFIGPGRVGGFGLVFAAIREGRPVPLLGRGGNRYQLLDVRDLADGLVRLADSEATGVVGFGATTFGTVADELRLLIERAATGSRLVTNSEPVARLAVRAIELFGFVPLAEWHHCAARGIDGMIDTTRARHELGWTPAHSNSDAMAAAYQWYVSEHQERGEARSTHPIPLSHRVLRRAASVLAR